MEILGFIVLIACLVIGVRFGGLGLAAVSGIGLTFFVFVVGLVPGKPPIDVMLTIMAVVTCSGFLQASKGLDVMLKYAEKLLRKNPKQITILAPITTWFLTVLCGTGHVVYTMFPIIYDIAIKQNIRPERPMAAASVASQMGICASPASVAVVSMVAMLAGTTHPLGVVQILMVSSKDAAKPAKFYMNSACAHQAYPTKKVTLKDANNIKAGSLKESNDRVIHQLIIDGVAGVRTCQLQMGVTELKEGSVWNTMPAHTHLRRMETYLYYNVPEGQKILHVMGEPQETRPIWLNNEQAVIAPEWSIHCAAGTSNYTFIWGMAGENLIYNDMQVVKIPTLE